MVKLDSHRHRQLLHLLKRMNLNERNFVRIVQVTRMNDDEFYFRIFCGMNPITFNKFCSWQLVDVVIADEVL